MARKGKLSVVGLGPGDGRLMTPQAAEALRMAEMVIGYRGYLVQVSDLIAGKTIVRRELGAERERAVEAIEAAGRGIRVALVSSGDPGIYGMASLVLEVLGEDRTIELKIVPGLTALSAAAALLGAPLGHDFAAISLRDLLTPWPEIERRLSAAGSADFVIVLYNPASKERTWQLGRARDLLLGSMPRASVPAALRSATGQPS